MTGRKKPEKLGDALQSYLRESGLDQRVEEAAIVPEWAERVGAAIAAVTMPLRTSRGTLLVAVRTSAWLMELRLMERERTTLDDLYLGPGPRLLFFLAEALLEYEQQFAEWRFKHVQLVERIIGPSTAGTGGTLGARYLQHTVSQKFFPALWEVRARLFGSERR